ncbi:hypothetical protein Salat_0511900, partial [Sesamum alatum]
DKAMAGCSDVDSFNNKEAIEYATTVVNLVMKEVFTVDANYGRYIKLRERFETFSHLISQLEIHWDRWENTMHSPTEFWQLVFARFQLKKFMSTLVSHITLLYELYSKDECQQKKRLESELDRVDEDAIMKLLT